MAGWLGAWLVMVCRQVQCVLVCAFMGVSVIDEWVHGQHCIYVISCEWMV